MFWFVTFLTLFSCYSDNFTRPLFRWMLKASNYERNLYNLKAQYKKQQLQLNLVDNFAKYSKIQRRINALDEHLQQLHQQRHRKVFFYKTVIQYSLKAILIVILVCFSIYYRQTPAVVLSKNFDLFPLGLLISYPIQLTNCISIPIWIICCRTMGSVTQNFF